MTKSVSDRKRSISNQPKAPKLQRPRREVQIVTCPSDFPKFADRRPSSQYHQNHHHHRTQHARKRPKVDELDWHTTAREIHSLGATAFEGNQKRSYQQEEYMRLTGHKMKQQKVPRQIQMGIQRKAEERKKRKLKEAREAGLVLPTGAAKKKGKKRDSTTMVHGPAPSVGYMKGGVLRLKERPK